MRPKRSITTTLFFGFWPDNKQHGKMKKENQSSTHLLEQLLQLCLLV